MKIVVFGASGKVGRLVIQKLVYEGNEVTAFIYGDSPFNTNDNLRVIKGDVHNLEEVQGAVIGSEVVVSVLGSWGTKQKDILTSGIKNIIYAMQSNDIKRVVSLTGADALSPTDKPGLLNRFFHLLLQLSPARKILIDGEQHIELLSQSDLEWTVLRSPIMNEHGDINNFKVSFTKPKLLETINRQSVANAMVNVITAKEFYKKSPYIRRIKN